MSHNNKKIGEFHLDGIPPAPAGVPQIEVAFDIDANGVLAVSAKDQGTGKQHQIRIENASGMSSDEIEKMKRDADSHADEDKKKREVAEAKVKGESLIHQAERAIKDLGEKVTEADKAPIQSAIEKLRKLVVGDDLAAIKSATNELEQSLQAMSQHIYSKGGGTPGGGPQAGGGPPPGGKKDDDVQDAEFEVK